MIDTLWNSAVAVGGMMTLAWLISVAKRDASIVDIFWGAGFVLIAVLRLRVDVITIATAFGGCASPSTWRGATTALVKITATRPCARPTASSSGG